MIPSTSGTCWTPWWTSALRTRRSPSSSSWWFFYHFLHHVMILNTSGTLLDNIVDIDHQTYGVCQIVVNNVIPYNVHNLYLVSQVNRNYYRNLLWNNLINARHLRWVSNVVDGELCHYQIIWNILPHMCKLDTLALTLSLTIGGNHHDLFFSSV